MLRALALVEPADPTTPLERRAAAATVVRVRPGAAPELSVAPRRALRREGAPS